MPMHIDNIDIIDISTPLPSIHCHRSSPRDVGTLAARRATIYRTLMEELELRKVCAWWVPKQLIEEHQKNCMRTALTFLQQYEQHGNGLLEWILMEDK